MKIKPYTLRKSNEYVKTHHRHSKTVVGCKFCIAAVDDDDNILGVAIVGRPVARKLDDGFTAEAVRVCVNDDSPKNSNSFLYGKCWRIWNQMGGRRLITYTLQEESGSSLKAAGYKIVGQTGGWDKGKGWTTRPGREWQPVTGQMKFKWIKE